MKQMIHRLKFTLKRQRKETPVLVKKRIIVVSVTGRNLGQALMVETPGIRSCAYPVMNPGRQRLVKMEAGQI
jgi:hypothetical protein